MSKLGGNHITIETRNRGTKKERIWKVFGLSADWHLDQTSEYRNSFPFTVKFIGGLDGSLEHQQWACQMPNAKYIWHTSPKYTQQLDG